MYAQRLFILDYLNLFVNKKDFKLNSKIISANFNIIK